MKRFLFIAAIIAAGYVPVAHAEDVTLCSGKPDGGYDQLVRGIANELEKNGHNVQIKNLDGSEAILNALNAGQCSFGPAQSDVYWKLKKDNASIESAVRPAQRLYREVMTLVCDPKSGIDELSDLTSEHTVIVDTFGSGSAITWDNIIQIEKEYGGTDDWTTAKPAYTSLSEAEATIAVGEATCAFGVAKVPQQWAKDMDNLGYTMAYIEDKDLNDFEYPKGTSLYNGLRVPKGTDTYTGKFDTFGVAAVLFQSTKVKVPSDVSSLVKRVSGALGRKMDTTANF